MFSDMINQKNTMKKFIAVFLMAIMGVALVYACGSESDEQFSGNFLEISLTCPDLEETREISRALGLDRTLSDIVLLRLTVEDGNPPIVPIMEEFDSQDSEITIDVTVGTDRKFTIHGLGNEGNVICQGETITDITVDTTDVDIACDFVFEDCTDGIDNDFDGLIDCEDPDCEDTCMEPGDDDDDNDIPAFEDDSAGECSDGIDNDEDGFTDCVDNDCIRSVDCLFPPLPPPPPPPACDPKECNQACCTNPQTCNSCECCPGDFINKLCSNPE